MHRYGTRTTRHLAFSSESDDSKEAKNGSAIRVCAMHFNDFSSVFRVNAQLAEPHLPDDVAYVLGDGYLPLVGAVILNLGFYQPLVEAGLFSNSPETALYELRCMYSSADHCLYDKLVKIFATSSIIFK